MMIFSVLFFTNSNEDFVVLADEENVLSFVAYGAFNTGVNLTNLSEPQNFSQTVYWNYTLDRDYIYFRDSTSTPGFTVQLYMSSTDVGNFVYSGESSSQGSIDKSNFKVYGAYLSQTPYEPTKGVDDNTKTLSINSVKSCIDAQSLYNFRFHDDLKDSQKNYSLTMSSSAQDYFSSGLACEVEGKIDISRLELEYPPATTEGTYESSLMILIVDGGSGEEV